MAVTHLSISCSKSKNVSRQQQHHTERFDAERKHRNKMIDPDKSKAPTFKGAIKSVSTIL